MTLLILPIDNLPHNGILIYGSYLSKLRVVLLVTKEPLVFPVVFW